MEQNLCSVMGDIDAIIAQAMAEYTGEAPIANYATINEPIVESSEPEAPVVEEEIPEIIPRNPDSLLVNQATSRFSSAIWYDNIKTKIITLAGLGGIGSYVAFLLGRLHPNSVSLYDGDRIEEANMSGQLYSSDDIGQMKSSAIANMIRKYSYDYDIRTYGNFDFSNHHPTKIMMCGFDSMTARRSYFDCWLSYVNTLPVEERANCLFIDGRLAAESLQVFCMRGIDQYNINKYKKEFLFTDAEADETICSYKQTSFMAMMIGSIMVNLFVNFCANECDPLMPRDLPFLTEYTAETMYFKVVQ